MIKELTEYYEPEKILHRKEQLSAIELVFSNFKKFNMASNLLIQGVTGSGKTTVINKAIKNNQEKGNGIIFVSGAETKTSFKTLKAIFDLNFSTIERVLTEGAKNLKRKPQIIIIDEVNKIKDCNNLFNDLNTIYRSTQCPIILITNKRTIIDTMPDDARLTLLFDKVNFQAYNALEIKDILKARLKLVKNIPKVPEGALSKISAYASKQGSARVGLQIALKCLLSKNYTEKYIDSLYKNLEREDWMAFVNGLMATERNFLDSLIYLSEKKQAIRHAHIIEYMKTLSPSRISQLITTFEDYGVLITEYRNLGRGTGRFRTIRFVSEELKDNIDAVLYPEKENGDKTIK